MNQSLFIIDLHYVAPLEKLDEAMQAHMRFLNEHYERGNFIASGRKVPRTGGVIIATAADKEEVDQWMRKDPFCKLGLSNFTITEFQTSQSNPAFRKFLKETKPGIK